MNSKGSTIFPKICGHHKLDATTIQCDLDTFIFHEICNTVGKKSPQIIGLIC